MINKIKKLRSETGAGILEIKQTLGETAGDVDEAKKLIEKRGLAKAGKKADRITNEGLIYSYIHANGRVGAMIELRCETDFVARTDDFQTLAKELAMQVAAMNPESVPKLLRQEYIRDNEKKISDLIKEAIVQLGENIQLGRFSRFKLGEG